MGIIFKARTVALYSVHDKTGKSTVARELAGFYQLSGKKTLLVDFGFGKGNFMSMLPKPQVPDLMDWIMEIKDRVKKRPWHEIKYSSDEYKKYIATHPTGLDILTCKPVKPLDKMLDIINVIMSSLADSDYEVIIFDLKARVREYIIRVLDMVETVLLITDTYRYDVWEVKLVMERLEEAGCKTSHFKVLFNKKPSFFDDSPPQIALDLGMPMAGSLPNYPEINENFLTSYGSFSEYSDAMKKVVEII